MTHTKSLVATHLRSCDRFDRLNLCLVFACQTHTFTVALRLTVEQHLTVCQTVSPVTAHYHHHHHHPLCHWWSVKKPKRVHMDKTSGSLSERGEFEDGWIKRFPVLTFSLSVHLNSNNILFPEKKPDYLI